MNASLLPYRTYQDPALADELTAFLTLHQIPFQQKNSAHLFDVSFSNNPLLQSYTVLLRKEDFEKVNELLNETAGAAISGIPTGHYLHTFTDEELIEIVKKPDEWNAHDVHRAMHLLEAKKYKNRYRKRKKGAT